MSKVNLRNIILVVLLFLIVLDGGIGSLEYMVYDTAS